MKKILKKHWITLLILFLIALVFFIYGLRNFSSAFSEAAVDLKYSRNEIQGIGDEFLDEMGYSLDEEYYRTIFFGSDNSLPR